MSIDANWGNFFKAEIKASGRRIAAEGKVSFTSRSETSVQAFVRATPPVKVSLRSEGVESQTFSADCSCPVAKKNQFCKHVWAILLGLEDRYPDFLTGKNSIEKPASGSERIESRQDAYQESAKLRASAYRKEQYQKQKLRLKESKREAKKRPDPVTVSQSEELLPSLAYFASNGFPMEGGPDEGVLAEAKKKLSRVFHPDKGGSHEETVELNHHFEVLMQALRGG